MDTPVRLLVVDVDADRLTGVVDLAEEEGIDIRTAVDAHGAIRQCRLEYLDLVMIHAGVDGAWGAALLETIRTVRPTVRAVLVNGQQAPLRQLLEELRSEPRHVLCEDEPEAGALGSVSVAPEQDAGHDEPVRLRHDTPPARHSTRRTRA